MNLWPWIARSVAATILGLLIFASLLSFMLVSHFSGKLLNVTTYTNILDEQDTYNRLYNEVLLDPQLSGTTSGMMGGIQLVSHQEIVEIIRRIAPPEYLQAEAEDNLLRAIQFMEGEREALELEIDVRETLPSVKPYIFEHIERRIDELDTVEIDPARDPSEQLAEVEELINAIWWDLATGKTPEAVPTIEFIPAPLRANVFDSLLPSILNDSRIDGRVRLGLRANMSTIRREFVAGNTRQFLKEVAHAGLTPLIDQGIVQVDRHVDERGQLDLVAFAADHSSGFTDESLREFLDGFRDQFRRWATIGGGVALTAAILATLVMFLIYLPSLIDALRWPGLTLLLTGLVLFLLGKFLESTLPRLINALVEDQTSKISDLPPAAMVLVNDLARQLTEQLFTGLANPALIILLVGGSLFVGSFVLQRLRPKAPWIR